MYGGLDGVEVLDYVFEEVCGRREGELVGGWVGREGGCGLTVYCVQVGGLGSHWGWG